MTSVKGAFGLCTTFAAKPGERDALSAILLEAAAGLEQDDACELYLVAAADDDPDAVVVIEVWRDAGAHARSLEDPAVRRLVARALPLVRSVTGQVRLTLVGGKGG